MSLSVMPGNLLQVRNALYFWTHIWFLNGYKNGAQNTTPASIFSLIAATSTHKLGRYSYDSLRWKRVAIHRWQLKDLPRISNGSGLMDTVSPSLRVL